MLAFVAVIIGLPLAIHWSIRLRILKSGRTHKPLFQRVGRIARKITFAMPGKIAGLGLIAVIVFAGLQHQVTAEYKLTHYLPLDSEIRYGEELANDVIGGRALLLMSVPFVEKGAFASPANRQRLDAVEGIVSEQFGASHVFSANRVLQAVDTIEAKERITALALEAPESARSGFLSKTGDSALISIRLTSDLPVAEVRKEVSQLRQQLAKLDYGDDVIVSGFPVLMSIEFTKLINQLRTSLMIAIVMGILFVGACHALALHNSGRDNAKPVAGLFRHDAALPSRRHNQSFRSGRPDDRFRDRH